MNKENKRKGGQFWKHVVIGGVPGILLGSGGTVVAENVVEAVAAEEDAENNVVVTEEELTPANVPVANVSDDMSFGEAFAAARAEVGAGGVFTWHGNLYNTYVAEEWEAMSVEERTEFANRVYGADMETYADEVEVVQVASSSDDEMGVQIEEIGVATDESGDQMIVAMGTINGDRVVFADYDCDGQIDVVVNEHGQEITDMDVTVDELCEIAMANENYGTPQDMYEGTPDYMNDADTTAFA